jgi:3-methyladenine DNA glycosylase AlkC
MGLSIGQQFEQERFSRAIDNCNDVVALRKIAKQLLQAWTTQKAATAWAIRQANRPAGSGLQAIPPRGPRQPG